MHLQEANPSRCCFGAEIKTGNGCDYDLQKKANVRLGESHIGPRLSRGYHRLEVVHNLFYILLLFSVGQPAAPAGRQSSPSRYRRGADECNGNMKSVRSTEAANVSAPPSTCAKMSAVHVSGGLKLSRAPQNRPVGRSAEQHL